MEDVVARRRDKRTQIIGIAHSKVQAILVDAGIDPAVARMIAAARIWQLLPPAIRQQVTAVESVVSTRLATLFNDVANAKDGELKDIPTE